MLRSNSRLWKTLGEARSNFFKHAADAIQRILPHVEVSPWVEKDWARASASSTSRSTEIRVTFSVGNEKDKYSRSLEAKVKRRLVKGMRKNAKRTLDLRERDIRSTCVRGITQTSTVPRNTLPELGKKRIDSQCWSRV